MRAMRYAMSVVGHSRPIQPILPAVHVRFAPKATDVLRCREWCDVPLPEVGCTFGMAYDTSSASSAFASFRSRVSKPLVNQP